ncbi:protein of unknown function [Microbacterium sp. Nx66]|nr:protein of unknown function [Microbacterium sp. Nx66]
MRFLYSGQESARWVTAEGPVGARPDVGTGGRRPGLVLGPSSYAGGRGGPRTHLRLPLHRLETRPWLLRRTPAPRVLAPSIG